MREIKFKLWHFHKGWKKDGKDMLPGWETRFVIYPDGTFTFPEGGWDLNGPSETEKDGILVRWTGLKDKNGKEIYEGDIIQVEGAIPAVIYWQYEAWQLRNGDKTGGMLGNWEPEQIEILGNIYENPELLK